VPDRLLVLGLMNYVFERDYVLLATLQVSPSAEPGVAVPVDVRFDYLSAPASFASRTREPDGRASRRRRRHARPGLDLYRWALPRPLAAQGRLRSPAGDCASPSRCRRRPASTTPISFRLRSMLSVIPRRRTSRATATS
jgi:hypothetical protein